MAESSFHFDCRIKQYCFAKIPDAEVDPQVRSRAQEVARFVSDELGIAMPTIRWIRPAKPAMAAAELGRLRRAVELAETNPCFVRYDCDAKGYTPKHASLGEIWIRDEVVDSPELKCIVAHEVQHMWQKLCRRDVFNGDDVSYWRSEADASLGGFEALTRYLEACGRLTSAAMEWIDNERDKVASNWCAGVPLEMIPGRRASSR